MMESKIFQKASAKQCADTGQLAVLITLIALIYTKDTSLIAVAIVICAINILVPIVYFPVAVIWFGIGRILSMIMQPIIFGIIFIVFVTPVGMFRRLIGKDTLKLRDFKKGRASVMVERSHLYVKSDLENTF